MPRVEPPYVGDERTVLTAYLDYHRETLRHKCEGLSEKQLKQPSVPPSNLTLLGLVRHCAEVEAYWSREVIEGAEYSLYCDEANPDGDFNLVAEADVDEAWKTWERECAHAAEVLAGKDLDDTVPSRRGPLSIRWILVHLVEEYARHNGHADLIRQCLDGVTGE